MQSVDNIITEQLAAELAGESISPWPQIRQLKQHVSDTLDFLQRVDNERPTMPPPGKDDNG